ncbi:MAG: macrolide family glycosyltransferase [Planctomycetota bacterium]
MARVAFLNIPAHGHTNPTLPVVRELARRGEEVTYFSSDTFREKIEAAGARFVIYREGVPFDSHTIDKNIFVNAGMVMRYARSLLPKVVDDLRSARPDYVIHDSICCWGKLAARIIDVPAACSVTMFAFGTKPALISFGFMRAIGRDLVDGFGGIRRWFRAARDVHRQWGVDTFDLKDCFMNREPLNVVYTSRLFQPRGGSFDDRYRFVGPSVALREEKSDLPLDDDDPRPLVYVSLGTIVNEARAFYRACFDGLGGDSVRVVMSVGSQTDPASLGEPPPNFIIRQRVPQLGVLARAKAFVTHAGMNSVSEAMLARVPLVLFPQTAEQGLVARQVEHLGAGVRLPHVDLTADRIREAVGEVILDPAYREGAERIGRSFEEGGGYRAAADAFIAYRTSCGIE